MDNLYPNRSAAAEADYVDVETTRLRAAQGALLLHRLVPAPDHGRGFRRDPETGFVYYSSEWLSDEQKKADDDFFRGIGFYDYDDESAPKAPE